MKDAAQRLGVWALVLIALVAVAVLAACAPEVRPLAPVEGGAPAGFPEREYRQAAADGRAVYRVDPARSLVVIEVRRAGSLARLGHDHVVASHDVGGYVLPDAGRADLYVRLDRLVVDEPDLRAEAGFETKPSADAIAGTRRNMLERVLEAERYPFALVSVKGVRGEGVSRVATVAITLHGATRTMDVPLEVESRAASIEVSGELTFAQSDFGIVPLSILGGAIEVQDAVRLRFRIEAGSGA